MFINDCDVQVEFSDLVIPKGSCLKILDNNSNSDYVCVHYNGYNYMIKKKDLRGNYEEN